MTSNQEIKHKNRPRDDPDIGVTRNGPQNNYRYVKENRRLVPI